MIQFLTSETSLPSFFAYPKFLLEMTGLSETAKVVYILLLDRAKISQKQGQIYIYYPIKDLAETIHKSEMSVKTALFALEKHQLILRKRQGVGNANRIYVKLPVDRNLSVRQTENCPPDGKKTVCHMERKLSGSKIKEKNNLVKRMSNTYGKLQNVFLSDDDIAFLQQTVPPYREYIERLSAYMQSSGKSYADHAATIRSWYLRDNPPPPARNYESEENESL